MTKEPRDSQSTSYPQGGATLWMPRAGRIWPSRSGRSSFTTKKWFGEADISLDALVVRGHGAVGGPDSFYVPQTRFGRVRDGEARPTGDSGLLVLYGKPLFFLEIFLTVSRDRKDSDVLVRALSEDAVTRGSGSGS